MIPDNKRSEIRDELDAIQAEEQVTILWACESGSRAWGFASKDSDFDVRFLYLRQTSAYLRASPLRDVIEKPISSDLDISGWDLPKALGLLRKSNPPLLEWLQSPIVYQEEPGFKDSIASLIPQYYTRKGAMYHYMSMAERNRRSYLDQETIRLKRYFYMLRPVLACMWIEQDLGLPPIEFQTLLNQFIPDGPLREAIETLKSKKSESQEFDSGPQIPIITDFIVNQMNRFTAITKDTQFSKDWEPLDSFFRDTIHRVNKPPESRAKTDV